MLIKLLATMYHLNLVKINGIYSCKNMVHK